MEIWRIFLLNAWNTNVLCIVVIYVIDICSLPYYCIDLKITISLVTMIIRLWCAQEDTSNFM